MGLVYLTWWFGLATIPYFMDKKNSKSGVFCIICVFILPWIIYHSVLILYHDSDYDWIKKEEALLRSASGLFRACIDEQYSQTLMLRKDFRKTLTIP